MNDHLLREMKKEVHPVIRLVVSLILTILGCMVVLLWHVTQNPVLGLIGIFVGLPCMGMGVALALGKVKQTKLSPSGMRFCGTVLIFLGLVGIYQRTPHAVLLLIFGVSCFKLAKGSLNSNGI